MSWFLSRFGKSPKAAEPPDDSASPSPEEKPRLTESAIDRKYRDLIQGPDSVVDSERFPNLPFNTAEEARSALGPDTPAQPRDSHEVRNQDDPDPPTTSNIHISTPTRLRNPANRFIITPDTPLNQDGLLNAFQRFRESLPNAVSGRSDSNPEQRVVMPSGMDTPSPSTSSPPQSSSGSSTDSHMNPPKVPPYAFGPQTYDAPLPPVSPSYLAGIYRPGDPQPEPVKSYHRDTGDIPRDEFNEYKAMVEELQTKYRLLSLKTFQEKARTRQEHAEEIAALKNDNGGHGQSSAQWSRRERGEVRKPKFVSEKDLEWKSRQIDAGLFADEDPPYHVLKKDPPLYDNLPDQIRQTTVDVWLLRCRTVLILEDWQTLESHGQHASRLAHGLSWEPFQAQCAFYVGIALYQRGNWLEAYESFETAEKTQGYYIRREDLLYWLRLCSKKLEDPWMNDQSAKSQEAVYNLTPLTSRATGRQNSSRLNPREIISASLSASQAASQSWHSDTGSSDHDGDSNTDHTENSPQHSDKTKKSQSSQSAEHATAEHQGHPTITHEPPSRISSTQAINSDKPNDPPNNVPSQLLTHRRVVPAPVILSANPVPASMRSPRRFDPGARNSPPAKDTNSNLRTNLPGTPSSSSLSNSMTLPNDPAPKSPISELALDDSAHDSNKSTPSKGNKNKTADSNGTRDRKDEAKQTREARAAMRAGPVTEEQQEREERNWEYDQDQVREALHNRRARRVERLRSYGVEAHPESDTDTETESNPKTPSAVHDNDRASDLLIPSPVSPVPTPTPASPTTLIHREYRRNRLFTRSRSEIEATDSAIQEVMAVASPRARTARSATTTTTTGRGELWSAAVRGQRRQQRGRMSYPARVGGGDGGVHGDPHTERGRGMRRETSIRWSEQGARKEEGGADRRGVGGDCKGRGGQGEEDEKKKKEKDEDEGDDDQAETGKPGDTNGQAAEEEEERDELQRRFEELIRATKAEVERQRQ